MGEFRITRPGKYRMRNGKTTDIARVEASEYTDAIYGYGVIDGLNRDWYQNGGFQSQTAPHEYDLVEGPFADETELAGLTGYSRSGKAFYLQKKEAIESVAVYGGTVIDLKTIRQDQLVRPEPQRETRKVTLVMWKNGAVDMWRGPPPVDPTPNPEIVAFVERDIEFTVGEGLGVKE